MTSSRPTGLREGASPPVGPGEGAPSLAGPRDGASPPVGPRESSHLRTGLPERSSVPTGLRERKKAKTRAVIRDTAMRLFEEQGYAATTVDQIAEEAEVSQSTFFRYFPTKEDVVLTDDYDPLIVAAIRRQPADVGPIDAVITAMHEVFGELAPEELAAEQRRQRLFQAVPELHARVLQQTVTIVEMFGEVIAERQGLPKDDFSSRVMAGAVVGVVLAVLPVGYGSYEPESLEKVADGLRLLRDGLPLG